MTTLGGFRWQIHSPELGGKPSSALGGERLGPSGFESGEACSTHARLARF